MIFQIFESGLSVGQNLILLAIMLAVVLGSIMIHEVAHGYASMLLGDMTAKREGRLSLNPLKHLHPIGTLCMIFCGFGWAKPVPIDPRYYKKPKAGMAVTALCGPGVNLLIGVMATAQLTALVWFWNSGMIKMIPLIGSLTEYGYELLRTGLYIVLYYNLLFAVFNLFPVPPLDGSRILFALLPDRYFFGIMRYEKLIMIVMFFFLWSGFFTGVFEYVVDFIIRSVGALVIALIEGAVSLAL